MLLRIVVTVKANARKNEVEKIDDGDYLVHTTELPTDGRANEKVIELLGEYFGIAKSRIKLFRGVRSSHKVFEVAM